MKWYGLFIFLLLVGSVSCRQKMATAQAYDLVERYNRTICEAYRRGDLRLIDAVVGPNSVDGKKLTGLIGVRLDMGITLDAELLELEVTGVRREKDELRVQTKERWRYRDRRIGTGEQVGKESLDSYELVYTFKKSGKAWLVTETRFSSPPQVGRETVQWAADARALHSFAEAAPGTQAPKGGGP